MAASVEQLCHLKGLDPSTLAARTGLDESRIVAILQGRWTPSPAERQSIAEAIGVGVDEIAWGHKIPIQHLYGHGPG